LASPGTLGHRIARRLRALRAARGLSLDALADQCGVSRSMISRIERAQSSPTAVLLERIATGLDVPLAALFDDPQPAGGPVARRARQLSWQDPVSGYVRRNVSPGGFASPVQIVEVSFPPLARVAYETAARATRIHQQVWLLEGRIDVTVGRERHRLRAGDCLALVLDQPIVFHNPARTTARYAVVLASEPAART
jgi:transcriptional regulator with XRE-family HTH domain